VTASELLEVECLVNSWVAAALPTAMCKLPSSGVEVGAWCCSHCQSDYHVRWEVWWRGARGGGAWSEHGCLL